jgi:hypothetical protein
MSKVPLCEPYFWEQPSTLVGSAWWNRWVRPSKAACASETVNEIAAVYLFTVFVGMGISVLIEYPLAVPVAILAATLYLIPAFMSLFQIRGWNLLWIKDCNSTEGFQPEFTIGTHTYPQAPSATPVGPDADSIPRPSSLKETRPTASNPFMNVLLDEIKYNPTRPEAADINSPSVNDTLDAYFRVQWSSDPTDVFGRTQSQRQFVAMPSTSIPNDAGSYQNWLYRIPGKTCKEGGREACLPGTDGGPVTWLNQAR